MNLYLDDVRPCPSGFVLARTAKKAIEYLRTGMVDFISFDHDLGENVMTGYDVALWIEEQVARGKMELPEYRVHSANPVGARRIVQAMESAKRFI